MMITNFENTIDPMSSNSVNGISLLGNGYGFYITKNELHFIPNIKNVIYNPPATIIFWEDGTKTVVKCQDDDTYDKERGFMMALIKKLYNGSKFNDILRKWVWENCDTNLKSDFARMLEME